MVKPVGSGGKQILLGAGFAAVVATCCIGANTVGSGYGYCYTDRAGVVANKHCATTDEGVLIDPHPGGGTTRIFIAEEGTYQKGDRIPDHIPSVVATNPDAREEYCIVETGPLPGEPGGFGSTMDSWLGSLSCGE